MERASSRETSPNVYNSRSKSKSDSKSFRNNRTFQITKGDHDSEVFIKKNQNHSHNTKFNVDLSYPVQNFADGQISPTEKITATEVSSYGTINDNVQETEFKLYSKRFFMLILFAMCSLINGFQWIQFATITSTMTCYYNVSATAVNWTSLIFMATYLPLTFPVAWFMQAKGLRFTVIVGAAINCLSSCVQCLSLAPNRFLMVMITQFLGAISQCFIVSVPPLLAATWFGPEEVSLACAFGVFGNQLGNALGFLVPPVLISNKCMHKNDITSGLMNLALGLTIVNAILFLMVILVFKDKPDHPPSLAEAHKPDDRASSFEATFRLLKDPQYLLLFSDYGILLSVYFAISTLLNQMVLGHFPGKEVASGWIGLCSVFAGMVGSVVCGFILDRTHKFKEVSISVNVLGFIAMVAYTGLVHLNFLWIHFVMISIIGFFMSGYIPIGFEYGSEITYPQPEGNSASLLNASVQLFGLIITGIGSWLLQSYGDIASNLFFCACTFIACILCGFLKAKLLRRQEYESVKSLEDA